MPSVPPPSVAPRRRLPHRVIVARGDDIRSFTIRPWMAVGLAALGALFAVVYLAATGYLVFRDDLLATSIARQARMQQTYEDRIAALRADIDRLTSRQLLNQRDVEAELDKLAGRQTALDQRQDAIARLSQAVREAGLAVRAEPAAADAAPPPAPARSGLKTSSLFPSFIGSAEAKPVAEPATGSPTARVAALETSLARLAASQAAYVDAVAASAVRRNAEIAAVLTPLGQKIPASGAPAATDVGGPFVPLDAGADATAFAAGVALATTELDRLAAARRLAHALPLGEPIADGVVTSDFGTRIDPFLGTPAQHTGIDFRAAEGLPVPAIAPGTVVVAEPTGGYGNMVEIDHGNGVTTRYGHLSQIGVRAGQAVARGEMIGKAGATGRATGPHLHYEVRVEGEAVDPMAYVAAGAKIAPLL
jgi:murein DD-endopeptidase MepM/ murein hydrolase activator NlpD